MKKRQYGTGKLIYATDMNVAENYTVDNLQQLAQDVSLVGIVSLSCLVTPTGVALNINIPATICRDPYGNRLNITAQQFNVSDGAFIPAILSSNKEQYITIYAVYSEVLNLQDVDINNNIYYKDHTDSYTIKRIAGEIATIGSAQKATLPDDGVLLCDIWISYPIGGSQTTTLTVDNIKINRQLLIHAASSSIAEITGNLKIDGNLITQGSSTATTIFSTNNPPTNPTDITQVAPIGYNDGRYVTATTVTGSTMTGPLTTPKINTSTGLVKKLTVSNSTHLEGATTIDGTLAINNNVNITGDLQVTGFNTTVGHLTIEGELLTTAVIMEWANSIAYTVNAIVSSGNKLWQCTTPHTSSAAPAIFTLDIAKWTLAGGGGSTTQQITLVNHGFTLGQVLYYSSTAPYYTAAIANQTSTLGLFIVSSVVDANDFVIMQEGYFNASPNPLVGSIIDATASFVGYISGNTLHVTGVNTGTITVGMQIGNNWVINGITVGTKITGFLTGVNGGIGTYSTSGSSQTIASGTITGMTTSSTFTPYANYYLSDTFPGYMTTIAPSITQQVLTAISTTQAYVVSYTPSSSALYWVDEFSYVTGTSTYTLTYRAETKQSMMVIVAGVPQYNADFDINGQILTLHTVYPNGASVRVWYIYTLKYAPGAAIEEFKQIVPGGGATTFTLVNQPISAATVLVSIDGVEQDSDAYYISGMNVITNSTVTAGKKVRILNIYASRLLGFDPNNTPDNTIPGAKIMLNSNLSCNTFVSTVATGAAPFTVSSTTRVANLNANILGAGTTYTGAVGIESSILTAMTSTIGQKVFSFDNTCTSANGLTAATAYMVEAKSDGTNIFCKCNVVNSSIAYINTYTSSTWGTWKQVLDANGSPVSTVAIGTAPLTVTSTTKVSNLNVDQVDSCDVETSVSGGTTSIPRSDALVSYIAPGWIPDSTTWTYGGNTNPNYQINTTGDKRTKYSKDMKLKLQQTQAFSNQFPLANDLIDTVGSSNGTMTSGSAAFTAATYGQALTLDGTAAVSFTDSVAFHLGIFNIPFTVGCRIKPTIIGVLFSSFSQNTASAGVVIYISFLGTIYVNIGNNTSGTTQLNLTTVGGTTTSVIDGLEHFVRVTYSNNWVQIYVDGKLDGSGYTLNPSYAATNYVRIGAYSLSSTALTSLYTGQIYDFFIIHGYALDEQTCLAQYTAGALTGNTSFPITKNFVVSESPRYSNGIVKSYPSSTTTSTLISYFPFDNNVTDVGYTGSGSGPNTISGNPNVTFSNSVRPYASGYSAVFTGTNAYMTLTSSVSLKPTGDFTFGCWIKTNSATQFQYIFQSMSVNPNVAGIAIFISQTTGLVTLQTSNNTQGGANSQIIGISNVCNNAWHYIVVTLKQYFGSIYVDGAFQASGSMTIPIYLSGTGNYVKIGAQCVTSATPTVGTGGLWFGSGSTAYIDDLYFINGYAETAYQIATYYATTAAKRSISLSNTATNYISYLPFENNLYDYGNTNTVSTGPLGSPSSSLFTGAAYSSSPKFGTYCAQFNGTSSYITLSDSPEFRPQGDFTIGFWIKTGSSASLFQYIFQSFSQNPNSAGISILIASTAFGGGIFVQTGNNASTSVYEIIGGAVTDNNWHYVVYTQKQNFGNLYIDGVFQVGGYMCTPSYVGLNFVKIGAYGGTSSTPSGWYLGAGSPAYLDDFFIINGYAQSAATIAAYYASNIAQGVIATTTTDTTSLTLYGGTDFQLSNSTISNLFYSMVQQPFNFNRNLNKWSVLYTFSDVGSLTYSGSPTTGTFYNIGNTSITVPIGNFITYYIAEVTGAVTSGASTINVTLSTSTTSDSSSGYNLVYSYYSLSTTTMMAYTKTSLQSNYSSPTILYLLASVTGTSPTTLGINTVTQPIIIKASYSNI